MTYPFEEGEIERAEMDLELLREDLIMVLQAINRYEEHLNLLEDSEARDVLEGIRDSEKDHFAELIKLIQKLDPSQAEKFRKKML